MNLVGLLLGAGALYVTDIFLSPMFGASEINRILMFVLQAWMLQYIYTQGFIYDYTKSH